MQSLQFSSHVASLTDSSKIDYRFVWLSHIFKVLCYLLVNLPYSLEISLMEADSFSSDSWQRSNIIFVSSVVNLIVIVTELIINPKYSISRDGTKTNFSGWTTKPVWHIFIYFWSIYQMSMLMLLNHQYMLQFLRSLTLVKLMGVWII